MMSRLLTIFLCCLSVVLNGLAASAEEPYTIWFPASGHAVEAAFRNNRETMERVTQELRALKARGVDTVYVHLTPMSSPEGTDELNRELSRRRGAAVGRWLSTLTGCPVTVVDVKLSNVSWDAVRGKALKDFRRCDLVIIAAAEEAGSPLPGVAAEYAPAPVGKTENPVEEVVRMEPEVPVVPAAPVASDASVASEQWSTSWYLKTNFLTYPLNLTANLAVEVEIGRHFSISVPFYYSSLDWFKNTIKFRMSGLQPEVRYWFRRDFTGFFAGAHATFGWYNVAVGGRYRYQDHGGNSPVFGGGINGGYRLMLGNHSRWALEFSLGAGYLPFYYDTFFNVENGALAESGLQNHYWGLDHAAVTLSFRFGKRRGTHE